MFDLSEKALATEGPRESVPAAVPHLPAPRPSSGHPLTPGHGKLTSN